MIGIRRRRVQVLAAPQIATFRTVHQRTTADEPIGIEDGLHIIITPIDKTPATRGTNSLQFTHCSTLR